MELLSSLESELLGVAREIDRRLRARKILVEGFHLDPILGYVAVKFDVLRTLRPPDEMKRLSEQGSKFLLEEIFQGLKGYVVATDAQIRHDRFDYGENSGIATMEVTMHVEHTYVMKDGKYLCEWGDNANPILHGEPLAKRPQREITTDGQVTMIRYNL